jgi:predicted aldo/keto reductase-like oxidoreductase
MRLPVLNGDNSAIDQVALDEMVDYALANGVNYFDTAWGYHGGNSEIAVGKSLSRYPRERYHLATKFPGYDINNFGKHKEIFEQQLKRCRVEYFDFYLFHNLSEANIDAYLDPETSPYAYLVEQRNKGRIRHLGVSTHATLENTRRFIERYHEDIEFCQIQLNYLDYSFQDAKAKLELLAEYGIPAWVMEPLRGGKLANLSGKYLEAVKAIRPDESAVSMAFRFLQSIDSVTVTLSGMSNMEQLQDNIRIFGENKPLNGIEFQQILTVGDDMVAHLLPCTACRYCTEYCPQGLDIPRLLKLYNEHTFTGGGFMAPMALKKVPADKQPSACIACRSCEAVCPQKIEISRAMANFAAALQK